MNTAASSPLDRPLTVSFLTGKEGFSIDRKVISLRELAPLIERATAPEKAQLGWLKLCAFGEKRTAKRSLRHDDNVLHVTGVEADYDAKLLDIDAAQAALNRAGIAGLIYTSPSYAPGAPKWRVLCPLAADCSPEARRELAGRLNTVLGGVMSTESFTASQSYYYGSVNRNPAHRVVLVDGGYLDRATHLAATFPAKLPGTDLPAVPHHGTPDATARAALDTACGLFETQADIGRHQVLLTATLMVAPFVLSGHLAVQDVSDALAEAMDISGRDPNPGEVQAALRGALSKAKPYEAPTFGAEFPPLPPEPAPDLSRFPRVVSRNVVFDPNRPYLIKGVLAPTDVGMVVGSPNAGKSTLAIHLGYAVAQGRAFMGKRTRAGRVMYVAAESFNGTQDRLGCLGRRYGDTDDFELTTCDNLNEPMNRAELFARATLFKPTLFILDTVAAAFAGMDENDSQGMGEVVAFARKLAATGMAVLLIHHPAKNGDGSPRGHSSLNGTLDMVLSVAPEDMQDFHAVVAGRLLKNRNGDTAWSCACRKELVDLGQDSDGDTIRTTLVSELTGAEARQSRAKPLSEQLQGALDCLIVVESETEAPVPVDVWRGRCVDRGVIKSDKPDTIRDSMARIKRELTARGAVDIRDDFARSIITPPRQASDGARQDADGSEFGLVGVAAGPVAPATAVAG